jgi:hypothetical protein
MCPRMRYLDYRATYELYCALAFKQLAIELIYEPSARFNLRSLLLSLCAWFASDLENY